MAKVGNTIAGHEPMIPLPSDRRNHDNFTAMAGAMAPSVGSGGSDPQKCGFWAYCHMNGQPCVWCGTSRNALTRGDKLKVPSFCPAGKSLGAAWFGCCRDPSGTVRFIGFYDCCGRGFCSYTRGTCTQWPQAKNWCPGGRWGANSYYCTVAVDMEQPDACQGRTSVRGAQGLNAPATRE